MLRGIIFDLDGVLVTTDELHYRAWKQLADEEGIPVSPTLKDDVRGVARMGALELTIARSKRSYSKAEKKILADRKNAYYKDHLTCLTPRDLLPGARAILDGLKALGLKLAIGSASKNTLTILEQVGIFSIFDAVIDGNLVTRHKPHPETFLLAARQLGLDPSECLVGEDAPVGVEAAKRAGMMILAIGSRAAHPTTTQVIAGLHEITCEQLRAIYS